MRRPRDEGNPNELSARKFIMSAFGKTTKRFVKYQGSFETKKASTRRKTRAHDLYSRTSVADLGFETTQSVLNKKGRMHLLIIVTCKK